MSDLHYYLIELPTVLVKIVFLYFILKIPNTILFCYFKVIYFSIFKMLLKSISHNAKYFFKILFQNTLFAFMSMKHRSSKFGNELQNFNFKDLAISSFSVE